ncbi:MAG: hypothetical protein JWM54_1799, partial [Acidobacteriaceae bacterium]|nr:hypothetical protein [Acidobacteriaceae bacterium]
EGVADLAPVEARVRDHDLRAADEESEEAEDGEPVGEADDRRMPGSFRIAERASG